MFKHSNYGYIWVWYIWVWYIWVWHFLLLKYQF